MDKVAKCSSLDSNLIRADLLEQFERVVVRSPPTAECYSAAIFRPPFLE